MENSTRINLCKWFDLNPCGITGAPKLKLSISENITESNTTKTFNHWYNMFRKYFWELWITKCCARLGSGSFYHHHLLGLHFSLFCCCPGLSCWAGVAPESFSMAILCFCTVLCFFSHLLSVWCKYIHFVLCVVLPHVHWLSYLI